MPRKNANPAAKKRKLKKVQKQNSYQTKKSRPTDYPVASSLDPIVGLSILASLAFGGKK